MTVFTDFRYVEQVSRQAPESRCVRTRNGQELHALVREALGGRQSLAIEDDFLSHKEYCYFADNLPGVALHSMEREVEPVSYTHLDVYKRQRQASWCARRASSSVPRRGNRP